MKRPRGLTFIALLFFVMAPGWLLMFVIFSAELIESLTKPYRWRIAFDVFEVAWSLIWAIVFLATGIGLWRLRRWARSLALALSSLVSLAYLADFFRWTSTVGHDYVTQWDSFENGCDGILLLPYYLVSWPIWAGLNHLWPSSWLSFHTAEVITSYAVGALGYAASVRYMLSARVKQAFSAHS